jgi:hypothetical protein
MTITIPLWLMWFVGVPLGLFLGFRLLVGLGMILGGGGGWR